MDVLLDRVIGLLYDSVLEEAQWNRALQAISDFTGGTGVGHVVADPSEGTITQCATLNIGPEFRDLYLGYYAQKEVRLPPAVRFAVGEVLTESMLLEKRTLERSEVYNDLLRPFDVPHFMFAWLQKTKRQAQTIAIEGSLAHGPFDQEAIDRFSLVIPHLVRATQLRDRFIALRASQAAYREALETLPFGVILLDCCGREMECTRLADEVIGGGDGLKRFQRGIRAVHHDDDVLLQAAIHKATRRVRSCEASTVAVRRTRSTHPLKVTLLPIASIDRVSMVNSPTAMMTVVDRDMSAPPCSGLLQTSFHLTKAEADLAQALFSGLTLAAVAQHLGRSINTCKSQLKSIYSKTDCRNHAELTKTLLFGTLGERH
jgi:DNA-binding CsgD family transcriptional regulator/PAS domain-containing protein